MLLCLNIQYNEIALAHPGRFKVIANNIDLEVSIGSIVKDQIDP